MSTKIEQMISYQNQGRVNYSVSIDYLIAAVQTKALT